MISFVFTLILTSIAAGFTKAIEVIQPALIVAKTKDVAHFMCEYKHIGNAKELQITLLKQAGNDSINICGLRVSVENEMPNLEKDVLCSIHLGQKHQMPNLEKDVLCKVHLGQKYVNVSLLGLQSTDAGLYICKVEQIYPPPYGLAEGSGTQLYVIETDPCPDIYLNTWLIVGIISGLLGYSILISIYAVKKLAWKSFYFTPGIYEKMISV